MRNLDYKSYGEYFFLDTFVHMVRRNLLLFTDPESSVFEYLGVPVRRFYLDCKAQDDLSVGFEVSVDRDTGALYLLCTSLLSHYMYIVRK